MDQRMAELELAHSGAKQLSDRRAMEKQALRPQMLNHEISGPANTIKRGGGEAGLQRVIGAGRKLKPKKEVIEEETMEMEGGSNGVLKGGAHKQGRMFAEHLMKLHGKEFLDDFHKGLMSVSSHTPGQAKHIKGGSGDKLIPHPMGSEIAHAPFSPGQMTPGAIAPVAYGNPPQAPASFKRNTIGMGRKMPKQEVAEMSSSESEEEEKMICKGGASNKRKARGALVSKLMREKGMSLAEASRYIKEKSLL